jgi:hypothetical protein
VKQEYNTENIVRVLAETIPDASIYGSQTWSAFAPHESDECICEYTDKRLFQSIPLETVIPGVFAAPVDISADMQTLENQGRSHGSARRHLNYRVRVMQRAVLQVEYVFQERTYFLAFQFSFLRTVGDAFVHLPGQGDDLSAALGGRLPLDPGQGEVAAELG